MPRSRRNKVVTLTKTTGKGRQLKTQMVELLRKSIDEYENLFAFTFENMRATKFKDVRMDWRESRIFLGKNTISQVALGRKEEDEFKDNLRHVSSKLEGNSGLLFTNRSKEEVLAYFKQFTSLEFGKAGAIPAEDIVLEIGHLPFASGSMFDQMRKLGLTVEMDDGKIALRERFVAAKVGVPLTPEQAKLLVHMNKPIIPFTIELQCFWTDGQYTDL